MPPEATDPSAASHRLDSLNPATPATHLEPTGVGANNQTPQGRGKAISRAGIKTKFQRHGNERY
jgi:hypothetical protein